MWEMIRPGVLSKEIDRIYTGQKTKERKDLLTILNIYTTKDQNLLLLVCKNTMGIWLLILMIVVSQ